jgi:polar amino acid transport system substrate-binding protein
MRAKLCVALLAFVAVAGCQQQESTPPPEGAASCELTVGWDPWEPYQYEDADGSVRGLDIEISALLASDAGCRLKYARGQWLELLEKLRDGKVDMLLAATLIPEREGYAWFSRPYRKESFALYVRGDELADLSGQDFASLIASGKRVGYTEGYYYGAEVNKLSGDPRYSANFIGASIVELNYSRLMDGSIDVLLDDPFVATSIIRRKGWTGKIARHPQGIASGEVSLMFSRKKIPEDLLARFNQALAARQKDGSLERLMAKYQS